MRCCSLIGSNVSGIRDIMSPFPEMLFTPSDYNDLSNKIEYLIHNKQKGELIIEDISKKTIILILK